MATRNQQKKQAQQSSADALPTVRQAQLLAAIVTEYSNIGQPVGSQEINKKYHFNISPATIRNEMMVLEKNGFIEQPHTSAGRVPTDRGYRYFVNELMKRFDLSLKEQRALREQLIHLQEQHNELGRNIAKLLANKTDQAAFALLPDATGSAGFSNIIEHSSGDPEKLAEVARFFDNIEQYSERMLTNLLEEKSEAMIGKENALPAVSNYTLIISQVTLKSGKKGVIGIVGPKSMRYDKNMTVVEYIAKLLSSGLLLALIIKI
jgi:transcriptional regulator of heat shock response